jgi:hypothetical protein
MLLSDHICTSIDVVIAKLTLNIFGFIGGFIS